MHTHFDCIEKGICRCGPRESIYGVIKNETSDFEIEKLNTLKSICKELQSIRTSLEQVARNTTRF